MTDRVLVGLMMVSVFHVRQNDMFDDRLSQFANFSPSNKKRTHNANRVCGRPPPEISKLTMPGGG